MTRIPPQPPPEVTPRTDAKRASQVRHYRLITPLFGGGVTPSIADPVTVIRGSEIRGHLRFWWRATHGAFGDSPEEMKKKEEQIWGSPGGDKRPGPSEVTISVEAQAGPLDHPFEVVPRSNDPQRPQIRARRDSISHPYAAFPLQPKEGEARIGMETKAVLTGVTFKLTLAYPEVYADDVQAALWAWEMFGGIGARTRRGFGALQCVRKDDQEEQSPSAGEVSQVLQNGLRRYVVNGKWPAGVPHLSQNPKCLKVVVSRPGTTPIEAWQQLIESLKQFRQKRRPGSDSKRPGRSYWPEPEAIRELTGQRHPNHAALGPNLNKFPRGAFGLPIIFHFKDQNRRNPQDPLSDPADTTLQGRAANGKTLNRLASPLILRPIACRDSAVGLALVLESPIRPPDGWELQEADGTAHLVEAGLSLSEARGISIEPLRSGQTDVLRAFLDTLESGG